MTTKPTTNTAVREELQRWDVHTQAAVLETRKLIKTGWIFLIIGWIFPIIPIAGYFLMVIGELVALIIGVVTIFKGNTKGGLLLILAAIIGSFIVGLTWAAVLASVFIGAAATITPLPY